MTPRYMGLLEKSFRVEISSRTGVTNLVRKHFDSLIHNVRSIQRCSAIKIKRGLLRKMLQKRIAKAEIGYFSALTAFGIFGIVPLTLPSTTPLGAAHTISNTAIEIEAVDSTITHKLCDFLFHRCIVASDYIR